MVNLISGKKQKTINSLKTILFYGLFLIYPFGQLLRIDNFMGIKGMNLLVIDLVAGLSILFLPAYIRTFKKYFGILFLYLLFINVLSLTKFPLSIVVTGSAYLARLIIYASLFVVVGKSIGNNFERIKSLQVLLLSIITMSISGWIQYFMFPDLRDLRNLMWDDHLYRMTSTLLDPNYFGAVVVIGILVTLLLYKSQKLKIYLFLTIYLVFTLLFTYSRASYISFFGMMFVLALENKNFRKYIIGLAIFVVCIFFLPRYSSEGVKLERLYSVHQRLDDYKHSFAVFKESPLFGIGYNNLCAVKNELGSSRSCGGSSNSILYFLATSGVIGLIIISEVFLELYKKVTTSQRVFARGTIAAIFIHSFFNNTLFYPFVFVPLVVFFAASTDLTIQNN